MDFAVYLLSNVLKVYSAVKFMEIFFDRQGADKKIEMLGYILYFASYNILYFAFPVPFLNLAGNFLALFALSFIYESRLSSRSLTAASISAINLFAKYIVSNLLNALDLDGKSTALFSVPFSAVLIFFIALVACKIIQLKNAHASPPSHWIAIFLIISLCIFVTLGVSVPGIREKSLLPSIIVCCMLAINLVVFFLYDNLIKSYREKYENRLLEAQNIAYHNQLQIIKASDETTRIVRHDMKNHIHKLRDMVSRDEKGQVIRYLNSMLESMGVSVQYINSGNADVDSILNYKIHEAKNAGAQVETAVNIPIALEIEPFDLTIILSNLMDNATCAIERSGERRLTIDISLERGILYITIENSRSGAILQNAGKLQTTKCNPSEHGMGLISVQNTVLKYRGMFDTSYTDEKFCASLLIYNIPAEKNNEFYQ